MEDDDTAKIGKLLEREYGEPHPQDLHIEYFFLLLGKEILDKRIEIIAELNKIDGVNVWGNLQKEWPELVFSQVKCPKISLLETERQREERLNQVIRMPLLVQYTDSQNPPRIIVSRACKYKTEVVKQSLSTPEIESILKTASSEHLDCFYLMIKLRNIPPTVAMPLSINLATHITGDWKVVEPVTAFYLTFIGHFPKKRFETEREREWRLNKEVRAPLKEYLEGLFIKEFQAQDEPLPEKLVSVVFTRVCTYTNM